MSDDFNPMNVVDSSSGANPTQDQQFVPELPKAETFIKIHVPDRHNARLQTVMESIRGDQALYALWHCQNVNAVTRLNMSDHGPVHVQIVANIALRMLRILVDSGMVPSIVQDYALPYEDAEVVVVLAALMHDLGISIHRDNHEEYSLLLATQNLPHILATSYPDPIRRTVVQSEILHAIIAHRSDGMPLTVEAGIVRIADALDMAKGRSRIPFERGSVNIHSVSAMAIERIQIEKGIEKPVRISIEMRNSAGIFQLDSLLKEKLRGSGLADQFEVEASITGGKEEPLVQLFKL